MAISIAVAESINEKRRLDLQPIGSTLLTNEKVTPSRRRKQACCDDVADGCERRLAADAQ
jgi:hypothetical protein